jgi:hypothetical protein
MQARIFPAAILLTFLAVSPTRAQDYPYDQSASGSASGSAEAPLPREAPATAPALPAPAPGYAPYSPTANSQRASERAVPALFRVGFKLGGHYTYAQSRDSANPLVTYVQDGFGFAGLVFFGWDLPYQPIFLEFESGYEGLFLTGTDPYTGFKRPVHMIPARLGVYRRVRVGAEQLFKFGFGPSMDFRISDEDTVINGVLTTQTGFSVVPSLRFSVIWETGGFLIQPHFTLFRLRSRANFFSFGALAGYRF